MHRHSQPRHSPILSLGLPAAQAPPALPLRRLKGGPLLSFLPRVGKLGEPITPNPKETQTLRGRFEILLQPPMLFIPFYELMP